MDTYPESYITKYTIFEIYEDEGDRIDVIGSDIFSSLLLTICLLWWPWGGRLVSKGSRESLCA